jgi:AcrR family transcriptional regulator/DNA-binding MarR family transcriptional regulator
MTRYSPRREELAPDQDGRTDMVPLGSGRQLVQRGEVTEIQRVRVISAVVDAVEEIGYARLTVAQIIRRARVSRKTFYDLFTDREDSFLAAFEQALAEVTLVVGEAFAREPDWRDGIRSGLARLLSFMEEEPGVARLALVESRAAGARVLARRSEVLAEMAKVVDRGRSVANATREPPALAAEGVVGAVSSVLYARLQGTSSEPLESLLGSLMSIIVLPYLGGGAARNELSRRAPVRADAGASPLPRRRSDPLDGLNMRLTYRTVRVLMFVAEHPGASNRQIAAGAEVEDQGQISKLLSRLARLDLVRNVSRGHKLGMANAWRLTERGAQLERAARPRS